MAGVAMISLRILTALMLVVELTGQQASLEVEGPQPQRLQLGNSAAMRITLVNPDGDPTLDPIPRIDGLQVQVRGPGRESSLRVVNGQMASSLRYSWSLSLTPRREGRFTIPPFRVRVGGVIVATSEPRVLICTKGDSDPRGVVRITPEKTKVYRGEVFTVALQFDLDQGVPMQRGTAPRGDRHMAGQDAVNIGFEAGWLRGSDGFERLPPSFPRAYIGARVGDDFVPFQVEELSTGGIRQLRFTHDLRFLPTRAGNYQLEPPVVRVVTQGQRRGLFLEQVPGETLLFYGQPISLEVLPLPEGNRPVGFTNAVGRFAIDAQVDRTSLQAGEMLKATVTIAGSGNLETLQPPDLGQLQGLHLLGQQVERTAEAVVVTAELRVLDETLDAFPSIPWGCFATDAEPARYLTLQTEPIPLRVAPAGSSGLAPLPDAPDDTAAPAADIFDIRELTLPPQLLPDRVSPWLRWAAALGPWLLAALGFAFVRRASARAADVVGQRSRGALARFRSRVGDDPGAALIGYVADRLGTPEAAVVDEGLAGRLVGAGVESGLASGVQQAIEAAVAVRYGGDGGLSPDRAGELVAAMERTGFRTGGAALVLLAVLLGAGGLPAQPAGVGVDPSQAYRRGDYVAAIDGYRVMLADPVRNDPRAWFNLGNAYWRNDQPAHAVWAWRSAQQGMPRDPELMASLALAAERLGVSAELGAATGERPFHVEVRDAIHRSTTPGERLLLVLVLNALAAGLVLLGLSRGRSAPGRSVGGGRTLLLRLGIFVAIPAGVGALELVWWSEQRPDIGIALRPVPVRSEPRELVQALRTIPAGAAIAVVGDAGTDWLRVEVDGRAGYSPRRMVGLVPGP